MGDHLTQDDVDAALLESLSPRRRVELLSHLLRRCPECLALVSENLGMRQLLGLEGPQDLDVYDEALDLAFAVGSEVYAVRAREKERQQRAVALLASRGGVLALCRDGDMTLRGIGVYEALLERCFEVRHEYPQERVALARAAVAVANDLNPAEYGFEAREVVDLRARAWGELGNAHRAADELREADKAFGHAFALLDKGTGCRRLRARLLDYQASLLGTLRRFDHAFAALDIVYELHLESGNPHLAGRSCIKKAIYTYYSGQFDEALSLLIEAKGLVDLQQEPKLAAVMLHNHLTFLVALGRYREAKRLLFENRSRCRGFGEVTDLKLRWLEGQVSYGLGQWMSAEAAFQEARHGFEEADMGFHAALAALDLATVWLRQGRAAEAQALISEAVGMFNALDIHREVLTSLLLLEEAFRLRKASVGLAERTADFIRHWQNNPDAQYILSFD